nr:ABC transporter permease [uncultured Albidiferax sp.]
MIFHKRARLLSLLRQLVAQEVRGKYLGSVLGLFWLVLIPLFTLALYTVVFGTFMKARWGPQGDGGIYSFALILFPGLLIFNFFSECVNRAPSLITTNPNYVKKVVFPLPLLALVPIATALLQFSIGLLVWLFLNILSGQGISWRIFFVPIIMLPFIFLILGIVLLLSALGVYVRDLISMTPIVTQVLMFLSPVLYPIEHVPANLRWIFSANPLTFVVEQTRAMLMTTTTFPWETWCIYSLMSFAIGLLGLKVFRTLRPGFADII